MLSLGDRVPKAAPEVGREGPGATASTTGVWSPRVPLAAGSDAAASELTRDCVFSMSVVSRQRVSSICHALDRLGRGLVAELGAETLVVEERLPCALGCNGAAAPPQPRSPWACAPSQARPGARGLRNLLQGTQLTGFSKLRFEPREPVSRVSQESVIKFCTLLPC